jgi:hypothetical protein
MGNNLKNLKEHKSIFIDLGIHIEDIEMAKKTTHIKFKVEYLGNKRIFVAPSSPSDQRGIKNFKGSITHWVRGIKHG